MINFSFDIDGVLSDYPNHFLNYVHIELNQKFSDLDSCKISLGNEKYEKTKDCYRKSTFKYQIPLKEEIVELSQEIYRNGGRIFVHSSRPFSVYPNMMRETSNWLSRGGMYFEKVSEKSLSNIISNRCQVHVDDEIDEIIRLDSKEFPKIKWVYLTNSTDVVEDSSIIVVNGMSQLRRVLLQNF